MTPKLKLREADRKALLSWTLKFLWPGNNLTITSMQMTEAAWMRQYGVAREAAVIRNLPPSTHAVIHR